MGINYSHATIIGWFKLAANIMAPLDKPLQSEITSDSNMHSDESTIKSCDSRLPGKGETEDDVEPEEHYFKRWIFCHYSPKWNLTQFVFYDRGRRSREAEQKYLEKVTHNMYLHTDGAIIYKCYDVCELIVRVSCLVHMRRPLYKLKHVSTDARFLVDIIDKIFHLDKETLVAVNQTFYQVTLVEKLLGHVFLLAQLRELEGHICFRQIRFMPL